MLKLWIYLVLQDKEHFKYENEFFAMKDLWNYKVYTQEVLSCPLLYSKSLY